jgi:hypothetical protein
MTTATATAAGRITRVAKLHLANPWTTVILPAIIISAIFVLNYAIWFIIFTSTAPADRADVSDGLQYSGATWWIFVYMLVVAVQAMNLAFPLAMGYGSTRRDFYLGSALTFVALSAMWSVALTLFAVVEKATNGFGIGGGLLNAIYFGGPDSTWWQQGIIFFCLMLFFFFVGTIFAAGYVRWKATGLVAFFLVLAVLLVGLVALFTYTGTWSAVGEFFVTYGAFGTALWLLVPTALAGIAGFFILRRATPRA